MDDLVVLHCEECGGPQVDGLTCWEQLGMLIAWEYNDPALQAVHFLIVAAYNFQHPAQFTAETLQGLQHVYIDYLDHGRSIASIRKEVGASAAGATKVLKPVEERQPVLRTWPMTIADVYTPEQPEGAAQRVQAWAQIIRNSFNE